MALETWLIKVKKSLSNGLVPTRFHLPAPKKSAVGVLAFEIAGLMSKLLHLWTSLSDTNLARLRHDSISLDGIRKIVSNDDSFLLSLACAELAENLRLLAASVSRFTHRCSDPTLRDFPRLFLDFADLGRDPHSWVLSRKDMEARNKKMDRLVSLTATLCKEMEELSAMEVNLRKSFHVKEIEGHKLADLQQKLLWQRQEVKYLKERSLWSRSFDTAVAMLARSTFTVLARVKLIFGVRQPQSLSRSLSASATVFPTENNSSPTFVSGPLKSPKDVNSSTNGGGFLESNSKLLKPPASTLGGAALALHYANLIIVMEKMIRSPHLVGVDARDDLYTMLPNSIRSALRARLRGVGFSATDPALASEWRTALGKILGWLSPLAHNMIKWQNERSFEQHNLSPKTSILLLQTLVFANKEKTEAAIVELLVGLNYIWRFEREMTAMALFECGGNLVMNSKSS